jgi:hypothetical protein
VPAACRLSDVDLVAVHPALAAHCGIDPRIFRNCRGEPIGRDLDASLARQLTSRACELAPVLGFLHTDSVRNLIRSVEQSPPHSSKLRQEIGAIREGLA